MPLLALSLGIFLNPQAVSPDRVRVLVRHEGPAVPYVIRLRQRQAKADPWQYSDVEAFPAFKTTSRAGRVVTVRVPPTLKPYAQLCAISQPVPKADASFQALLTLESCWGVPRPSAAAVPPGSRLAAPVVDN